MQIKDEKFLNLMEKLAQKKSKIELREKVLKEKERKLKIRRYIEVGSIAAKFEIDRFDDATLMGAFAEMQERSKQSDIMNEWKAKGETHVKTRLSPIIISSEKEFTDSVKTALKERKFKWNSFRKEWYGYGIKEEIEELMREYNGRVDVAKG